MQEEIQWLILCGESAGREPLLEDFGGYWEEQDLWSEEFVPGQTLDLALRRLSRREHEAERFRLTWPFWAWSAMSAYVDFWNRTGMRQEISDPGTVSVIVPTHDYLTGARIVSVSARRPVSGLIPMVLAFRSRLVEPVEGEYPALAGIVGWDVIFSSVLEVVGEDEGIKMFLGAIAEQRDDVPEETATRPGPLPLRSRGSRGSSPCGCFLPPSAIGGGHASPVSRPLRPAPEPCRSCGTPTVSGA